MKKQRGEVNTYVVVALTTLVTGIVSLLVNEPVNSYLNRAKPSISVTSVGFAGPLGNESILVPEEVVRTTSDSLWLPSLKNYEQFEKLIEYDKTLSVDTIKLEKAIEVIVDWKIDLEDKLESSGNKSLALTEREIIRNPLLKNGIVAETVFRTLRIERTASSPLSLEDLDSFKKTIKVNHDAEKKLWSLSLGIRNISIPYGNTSLEKEKKLQTFARTIARGSVKNMAFYSQLFIDTARARILEAKSVQEKLRDTVYPVSRLVVNATLHNEGNTSVTFRPHFGLKVLHQSYLNTPFYLALDNSKEDKENPFSLNSNGFSIDIPDGKAKGKEVEVSSFIPEVGTVTYISIQPQSIKEVTFVGTTPLEEQAEDINSILKTKSLKIKLLGITADKGSIWSQAFTFSEGIDSETKTKIDTELSEDSEQI